MIGSPPLLDAALHVLCEQGARLAQPGEFTLRAFLAGRVDLTQAEAVLGVIDAENSRELQRGAAAIGRRLEQPLDAAARRFAGLARPDRSRTGLRGRRHRVRPRRRNRRPVGPGPGVGPRTPGATGGPRRCEPEPRIVLRGEPNVGKSSLFNALVRAEAAIVSPQAGTTRDYVSRPFHWHEVAGILVDTPGYEDPSPDDPLADAANKRPPSKPGRRTWKSSVSMRRDRSTSGNGRCWPRPRRVERLVAWTKADLVTDREEIVGTRCLRAALPAKGSTRCDRRGPPRQRTFAAERGGRRLHGGAVSREPARRGDAAAGRPTTGGPTRRRGTRGGRTARRAGSTGSSRRCGLHRGHPRPDFQPFLHRQVTRPPVTRHAGKCAGGTLLIEPGDRSMLIWRSFHLHQLKGKDYAQDNTPYFSEDGRPRRHRLICGRRYPAGAEPVPQ